VVGESETPLASEDIQEKAYSMVLFVHYLDTAFLRDRRTVKMKQAAQTTLAEIDLIFHRAAAEDGSPLFDPARQDCR
jgi:hypothetical protein